MSETTFVSGRLDSVTGDIGFRLAAKNRFGEEFARAFILGCFTRLRFGFRYRIGSSGGTQTSPSANFSSIILVELIGPNKESVGDDNCFRSLNL
jgi:hypothetical protein